jgi:hypothetical protein
MGTKGCVAFRYRGIYYIFYNSHDSYFSALGQQIVNEINGLILDREEWEGLKEILTNVPLVPDWTEGETIYRGIYDECQEEYQYITTERDECYGSYNYILDLDNEEFVIIKYDERRVFKVTSEPFPDIETLWSS